MDSILTVTSPASIFDIVDAGTLKEELGVTQDADDGFLGRLVTQASAVAAQYCCRVFASETVQEVIRTHRWDARHRDGSLHSDTVALQRFPVTNVASVTADGTALAASTDYEIDPATGLLYRLDASDNRVRWTFRKLVVVYTAGYALPAAAPADLQRAVVDLCKLAWFARSRDPMLRSQGEPGLGQQVFWIGGMPGQQGSLPPAIASLLDPFRVPVVA